MDPLRSETFSKANVFEKWEIVNNEIARLARPAAWTPDDLQRKSDLEDLAFRIRRKASLLDPVWDMEHNLVLANTNRETVLFHPKPAQLRVLDRIEKARADKTPAHPFGRPVRLYMPKTRRVGGSQITSGYFYREWRNVPNTYGLVMAHNRKSSEEIFRKYRTYWMNDPFRPDEELSSSNELFGRDTRSMLTVMTAGVSESSRGHGFGFALMHLSECDHYQTPNPERLVSGLLATVPPASSAWSCVVLETTGNGRGSWFFNDVMTLHDAEQGGEKPPELMYSELLFLPSTCRDDAFAPFESPKHRDAFIKSMTDEELVILEKYRPEGVSEEKFLEFVNWRRITYANEIKGSSEADRRRRMREAHPLELMDCFQASGGSAFDQDKISLLQLKAKKPHEIIACDVEARDRLWSGFEKTRHAYATPTMKLVKHSDGPLSLFERPKRGHRYCIGVDVAGGFSLDEGDWSVAVVFDRDSRRIAARYRARIPGIRFVNVVRLLSSWYNDAQIGVEVNYDPTLVAMLADTDRREFLYQRQNPTGEDVNDALLPRFGWNTSNKTKNILVNLVRDKLENEPGIFVDPLLLHEMSVYQETYNVTTRRYKFGARGGEHDDVLMAFGIAMIVDQDSYLKANEKPADLWKPPTIAETWERWVDGMNTENDSPGDVAELEPTWMQ